MNVQLVVDRIQCRNTTEQGHDEIYLILGGARYDGNNAPTEISGRPPNRSQGADADLKDGQFTAWDCNDSGQMRDKRLGAAVFNADVPDGGHVVLTANVMESDGTNVGDQIAGGLKLSAAIARAIPGWGTVAAGVAEGVAAGIKALIPNNEDDHLGSIAYAFANQGGRVFVTDTVFGSGASTQLEASPGQPYTNRVRFRGDGADYTIDFRLVGD